MLRPALLAAALTAAFPVHADPQLDALRAELQELKTAYEARIQALEARLQQTETQTADAAVAAEPAPVRSSFNPDASLILQGKYAHLEDRADRGITGFLPSGAEGPSRGFSVDESELVLSASIDPYFRGYLNAVLADGEVGVEEAWFQTTSLGQGLSIKGGRFRSGIGYQNEQHPHAWDFATNSLVYDALFGEGYAQDGLQVKWLAPTDTFLEFGAEAGRGGAFPSTERDSNGFPSLSLFGHVGDDVGTSHSWRAGLAYLHARPQGRAFEGRDLGDLDVAGAFSGKSRTWLADFVWKWAPNGNATQRNFKFAAEYFQRRESGALNGDISGPYSADQSGLYAQGVDQFMPHWRVGYRYDQLFRGDVVFDGADAGATLASLADYDPRRHSLMLDYSPSEFSRLRLQYSRDEAQQDVDENQFYVQYIHSLGSHGAHKF
ncbi:MAG TPA: TonB-dependent receptor [Thiobacillus sp.]|nr:TonB-dependent receptor [Thiobacillus sp.]